MSVLARRQIGIALLVLGLSHGLAAQEPETLTVSPKVAYPTADEVADLLKREPLALENWTAWRGRLVEWLNDRSQGTDPAFDAARKFVYGQLDAKGELPLALRKDNLAWYLLGIAYYFDTPKEADHKAAVAKAERALRESLKIDGKLAKAHRDLAMILLHREDVEPSPEKPGSGPSQLNDGINELQEAVKLDPSLPMAHVSLMAAKLAYRRDQYTEADVCFSTAFKQNPTLASANLKEAALAILLNTQRDHVSTILALDKLGQEFPTDGRVAAIHAAALAWVGDIDGALPEFSRSRKLGTEPVSIVPRKIVVDGAVKMLRRREITWPAADSALQNLIEYFPDDGILAAFHGYTLWTTGDGDKAIAEFRRARALGADPGKIEGLNVREIEATWLFSRSQRWFGWSVLGFLSFYLVLMGLMAFVGRRFSVTPAPASKPDKPAGDSASMETVSKPPGTIYLAALVSAAVLFYLGLVLLLAVLIGAVAGLVLFIFNAPTVPFSLVCTLVVVIALAWVYLSTIFTAPRRERSGIPIAAADAGRLRQVVDDVRKGLDADPVDEIRLSTGADVRIWPTCRGPFGIFGGKQRILTVGYAALRYLNVGELQALLARQFALFRRRDSRGVRFVALAHQRIEQTLDDIRQEGGKGNYINPFFIFLNLYGQAFDLLAAGFTRGRILEADQEAARLHGSTALINALMKTNVDAVLFAARARKLAEQLLPEAPDLSNVYAAWEELCSAKPPETGVQEKSYRHLAIGTKDRDRMWEKTVALAGPNGEPALRERLDLLGKLPKSDQPDDTGAVGLIDNVEALEEELTEIVTDAIAASKEQNTTTPAAATK
jgi:tetratricopeptide (TPR) repeat protein